MYPEAERCAASSARDWVNWAGSPAIARADTQPRGLRALLASIAAAFIAIVAIAPAHAQEDTGPAPEVALEHYLEERGLRNLLITHLLARVRATEGAERAHIAERLGSLYVQMLDEATTPDQRRQWEARAVELLESVPEAESLELRLTLAKARYLQAEEIAERHRLRLATPEERQEAETTLRAVAATLRELGNSLNRRVELLERREALGRDDETSRIRTELGETRRLRSLAMYYAGWSAYYGGFLRVQGGSAGHVQLANDAINHFGWLLNASGRPANVERVTSDMMRYEHVARAAIGCALSESLRGRDGAALLWLHTIDSAPELPENVRRQLPARRMAIFAAARRWADLERLIRRQRTPERDGPVKPLETSEARLLAVLMLEALEHKDVLPQAHDIIRTLADAAITDLITRGDARHVHDLVSRYGTGLLAGEGFIVQYVRGLHAYEKARQAHANGENDQEPTTRDDVANLYAAAAQMFDNASSSGDAAQFPGERFSAAMLGALCTYYSGRLEEAADRFEKAHRQGTTSKGTSALRAEREATPPHPPTTTPTTTPTPSSPSPELHEDALWMAIVALDKAVDGGRVSLKERRERLATLYLHTFPTGERAAMLLLRLGGEGLVTRERAAEILLGISRQSPLYDPARRHAADLLYAIYRRSRGPDRDFAALRFAEVSDELFATDLPRIDGTTDDGRETARQALLRLRQVLDAVLGMSAPDLERAQRALDNIQAIARRADVDIRDFQDEVAFRQFQVALLRGRNDDAQRAVMQLQSLGGRFADAADRMMYQRALTQFRAHRTLENAANVVQHGIRVVSQFGTGAAALSDPVVQTLYNAVADAAAYVWQNRGDEHHRDIALRLDRALVERGSPPAAILRRFADLAEPAGDLPAALDAWRTLMSGLPGGSPDWFEARFHSLRLLARTDPARAREAFAQFKILYPSMGPQPWAPRFAELERELSALPDTASPGPRPAEAGDLP